MKFGKRLFAEAERRWMTSYVDYKALKRAIKQDVDQQDPNGPAFAFALKAELAKVDAFYTQTEQDLEATTDRVAANGAPLEAIAFLRSQVLDLRKFVVLNYIAVVKACKKRNRHLRCACEDSVAVPALRAVDILAGQQFFISLKLAAISTRVEIISREHTSLETQENDFQQDFLCPICIGPLRAPVVLTCLHRFCWGCLMTHCTTVRSTAHNGHEHGHHTSDSKPVSSSVSKPALWVSEVSDDENASVATFACPCCRKDQLLDLDRLQVDPYLDSYMKKMEESGSTVITTTHQIEAGSAPAPRVLSLLLENATDAASAEAITQPIAIKTTKPQIMEIDIDVVADACSLKASALVAAAVDDVVQPAVANILLPPLATTAEEKPLPLLPPQRPEHRGRITVCLDLDGTLVTTFTPKRAPVLPSSAISYIVGRGGALNPQGIFVVERPGLGDFLRRLYQVAEVVLFTAGLEDYAKPICDEIERRYGAFPYRLYRPATVHSDEYPCVKDLSRLGRDLDKCLLVDDTPLAFFHQPDCGVPVLQFRGDVDDRLLSEAVTPLVEELSGHADVRIILAKRFNMRRWFAAQGLVVPQPQAAAPEVAAAAAAAAALALPPLPSMPHVKTDAVPRTCIPPLHNAPAAHLLNSTRASAVLLVCDFDKTLTDWDAAERLCDELAPELTSLLTQIETPANFVPTTNAVLGEMQRRGISRDQIVGCLRGMAAEMPAGTLGMLHWAACNEVDVRILSDCNSLFIGHILTAAKVHTCVREVITNPAAFQRIISAEQPDAPAVSGMSRWAAQIGLTNRPAAPAAPHHKLVIQPRHDCKSVGSHGCHLCPSNICKGRELDALFAASGRQRIVYAGDGANDLCPALCLGPDDVVLARADHPLERLLAQHRRDGGEIAARVEVWHDHEELAKLVRQAVTM